MPLKRNLTLLFQVNLRCMPLIVTTGGNAQPTVSSVTAQQKNILNTQQKRWRWRRSIVVRTLVSAGELSLSCAKLLAGWVTTLWLRSLQSVSQHGQHSLPSLQGQLKSSNSWYSGLGRQMAQGTVRGVAYCPRQWVLLAARLECRLAAGSRPRNRDERRSLAM